MGFHLCISKFFILSEHTNYEIMHQICISIKFAQFKLLVTFYCDAVVFYIVNIILNNECSTLDQNIIWPIVYIFLNNCIQTKTTKGFKKGRYWMLKIVKTPHINYNYRIDNDSDLMSQIITIIPHFGLILCTTNLKPRNLLGFLELDYYI